MTLVASHTKKNQKERFSMIFENISIIFAQDFNFEKYLKSSKISSKISFFSSLGVLGICISSLVWLKPSELHKSASFCQNPNTTQRLGLTRK